MRIREQSQQLAQRCLQENCTVGGESTKGNLAEWSKAPASGAGPKGREFESLSYHFYYF